MLLAVLERKAGFKIATRDVFLNLAGGLRVTDPALDLAVIAAVLSSGVDRPLSRKLCFSAEVGLSGEIRPVTRIEARIREAGRLGFESIILSGAYDRLVKSVEGITVIRVNRIEEVVQMLFQKR